MRRVSLLGLFRGLELEEQLGGLEQLLGPGPVSWPREDPQASDPQYDPLSDWMDEPFPEELR